MSSAWVVYLRDHLGQLDRLLRGDATKPEALADRTVSVSAKGLAVLAVLMAMFYGACMGSFSLLKQTPADLNDPFGPVLQVIAASVKTPALFFLTLVVTLPSLYVANALIGSRLTLLGMTKLLVASLAVNVAVLASLGTIVLFFSLTTNSYSFVVVLNVAAFSIAGSLGLMFLLQTLHRVLSLDERGEEAGPDPIDSISDDGGADPGVPESALEMPAGQVLGRHTRLVFRCWIVLFSLVGAQMGWVLRPFIGQPDLPFALFRPKESNFFASVLGALWNLMAGGA